jgi:PA14 domain-containing protein
LIALLVTSGVAAAARTTLQVTHGLTAEYFADDPRTGGAPAARVVTPAISTEQLRDHWRGSPPSVFSARWFGYLTVRRPGLYTFATSSDDGSSLSVDGTLVVNNGGVHGEETRMGRVWLDRGPHFVLLEYAQAGGDYAMNWAWARDGGSLSAVPPWALSPGRVPYWKVMLARALDWLRLSTIWLFVLGCSFVALQYLAAVQIVAGDERDIARPLQGRRPVLDIVSLALFIALAILHTWPLASDPARLSRNDNGDTMLNEWTLAWFAHQAPRDPLHLYDANIFYPERRTLAYSEAMIVQSAIGAPIRWLGAGPVLVYNLVLLAGFVLTGWTMSLVIAKWTGDWIAGLASGILIGFNAHTLTRIPHLQAHHVEFLPLALFALDRLLRQQSARHAISLSLWFTLQALTSVYLLVFTAVAMIAATLARPEDWWGRRSSAVFRQAMLAAGLAGVILLPFLLPYWHLYEEQGLSRSLAEVRMYSASWTDYLMTPGRLHYAWWSHRFGRGTALFPGFVGLGLTGLAIWLGGAMKNQRARMCLAAGLCGVLLSFGPKLPGYAMLYEFVPPLHAIRAAARFGYLGIVAVAMVGGFGLAELRRRLPGRIARPLSVLVLVLAALEPFAAPLGLKRAADISPIYRQVRSEPGAIVVEMPFPSPRAVFVNAQYMLNSTAHWKPILNGYSGFVPGSYRVHSELLSGFPDATSIAALQALGVTHVFVHLGSYGADSVRRIDTTAALRKMAQEGTIALYRLEQ